MQWDAANQKATSSVRLLPSYLASSWPSPSEHSTLINKEEVKSKAAQTETDDIIWADLIKGQHSEGQLRSFLNASDDGWNEAQTRGIKAFSTINVYV